MPREFRRTSRIPEILVLHRAHFETSEVEKKICWHLRTAMDELQTVLIEASWFTQIVDSILEP